MRCDLHVHTTASGMCSTPGLGHICRESYNEPAGVYERAKALGMSVVTVTDHDSIDAGEELRRHADFFLSEEVTVTLPSGTEMHLGVYGITERDHVEIQKTAAGLYRAGDVPDGAEAVFQREPRVFGADGAAGRRGFQLVRFVCAGV